MTAMPTNEKLLILLISGGVFVLGKLKTPGGPLKLHQDPTDSFSVMEQFKNVVAISDADNETIFECLSATRTNIDPETHTATYNFLFSASRVTLPFRISRGEVPGTVTFTVAEDLMPLEGQVYYTDFENCVVVAAEFYDQDRCILWTRREVKDAVPQDCIDHFVDTCGVIVPQHSRDLCPDGEGDY
ncbi:uncharacterized protein LOC144097477 isoform X1 [Amblyomma americanum]